MSAAEPDEFDLLPDEYEGLQVDWHAILGPPAPQSSASPRSSQYSFDTVDDTFLAHVDELERQALSGDANTDGTSGKGGSWDEDDTLTRRPSSDMNSHEASPDAVGEQSRYFTSNTSALLVHDKSATDSEEWPPPSRSSIKRVRRNSSSPEGIAESKTRSVLPSPPTSRRARKRNKIKQILEGFEDEMTCPICCDILVAAHLGNPCGHSFCGECGWKWISQNRNAPTCACCRAKLNVAAPMIPNFAMDNTVEKHVQALAASGNVPWQKGGKKYVEWQERKESWKKSAETRNMTRPYTAPQRFRPYAGNDELEWLEYNGGHSGTGRFGAVEEPRVMTHGRRYRGRR